MTSARQVLRQPLLDLITQEAPGRVVLIHGPAGFGKSTLMSQLRAWFQEHDRAQTWLNFDESDNDVSRFLASFRAAVEQLEPHKKASAPTNNFELSFWILERIASVDKPAVIFFDDFEALHSPTVIDLINQGIEGLPPEACVVIGTRASPKLNLSSWRASGRLLEIDAASLRFSEHESRAFLAQRCAKTLREDQVERLHRTSDGWVTALWLAALTLNRSIDVDAFITSFSGANASVAGYLAEDVLASLPQKRQRFLLTCAVLDELEESICNAICGSASALEQLRELERLNLFLVPLDEAHQTFRFHSLFRQFLINRLKETDPRRLVEIHRAASKAYLDSDRIIPAIHHAISADPEKLGIPLLVEHADSLLAQGRMRLLAHWIGRLPPKLLEQHPKLNVALAWTTTFSHGPLRALDTLKRLEKAKLPGDDKANVSAIQPLLLALLDKPEEAHELGLHALEKLPKSSAFASAILHQTLTLTSVILGKQEDAYRFINLVRGTDRANMGEFGELLASSTEALLDLMAGRLRQALARLDNARIRRVTPGPDDHQASPIAGTYYAEMLYEQGELERARNLLRMYAPMLRDMSTPDAMISAHVILARAECARGDEDHAFQRLAQLETSGHKMEVPRIVASARLELARMYMLRGDSCDALFAD